MTKILEHDYSWINWKLKLTILKHEPNNIRPIELNTIGTWNWNNDNRHNQSNS